MTRVRIASLALATDSAPGANDDGSGTVAVMEAARVLSRHRFSASIACAALAGEEQGLLGGRSLAHHAQDHGWRVAAVLNNDIVGNIAGADGVTDSLMVRVFSDAVPPTPGPLRAARLAGGGQPAARLAWAAPQDSGAVAGYRVYWRRTDSPTWDHSAWIGDRREHAFTGLTVDNYHFGVASVGKDGHESTVVFPVPGRNR